VLLAQLNIGLPVAPLTEPELAGFVEALEPVNALADAAPGFVWRLQTEDGDATSIRIDPDPLVIVNMSVWESADALWDFVYSGDHLAVMRRRREWFRSRVSAHMALWWVPDGHTPSVGEGLDRLALLERDGPTPQAFTFKHAYAETGERSERGRRPVAC
jgi:Domain of unknown function (DUF3291)